MHGLILPRVGGMLNCSSFVAFQGLSWGAASWHPRAFSSLRSGVKCKVKNLNRMVDSYDAHLPFASKSRFTPDRTRLGEFSEERLRWKIPIQSRWQVARNVKYAKGGVHVLTEGPVGIHSFWDMSTKSFLNLDEVVPYQTREPSLCALPSRDELVLFLPNMNTFIALDAQGGRCRVVPLPDAVKDRAGSKKKGTFRKLFQPFGSSGKQSPRVWDGLSKESILVVDGGIGSLSLDVLDFCQTKSGDDPDMSRIILPGDGRYSLLSVDLCTRDNWLLSMQDHHADGKVCEFWLVWEKRHSFSTYPVEKRKVVDIGIDSSSAHVVAGTRGDVAQLAHANAVIQRVEPIDPNSLSLGARVMSVPREESNGISSPVLSLSLNSSNQSVVIQSDEHDEESVLQVVDHTTGLVKYIQPCDIKVNKDDSDDVHLTWQDICEMENGDVVTLQVSGANGILRCWQVDSVALENDLNQWKKMMGSGSARLVDLQVQGGSGGLSANPPAIDQAKHGKEDPDNTPHVGGSTWAGGTGGSNTAGLGGRGGPYRLDKGHPVHQVSEAAKREVDDETLAKARELNRKAFAERLEEIHMTEDEHDRYTSFLSRVEAEVSQLRNILDGLESRKQERTWLKNQSFGDLDDTKLVDGVTGEKLIYKRRGVKDNFADMVPEKPKRLRFVMDCSGSMYRFNSQDGRLERECELAVMIMEALDGFDSRFEYSIVGHSGESEEITLVDYRNPPRTQKQKLQVCLHMIAHAQFCMSGDMTLPATRAAVENVTEEEADDYFVFVVSDANLRRYGIPPQALGAHLVSDPKVKAYAIFIASLGEEAERIKRELPMGKGFVVFDTADLPNMFREILVTNIMDE